MQSVLFMTEPDSFLPSANLVMPRKFIVVWGLWTFPGFIFYPQSVRHLFNSNLYFTFDMEYVWYVPQHQLILIITTLDQIEDSTNFFFFWENYVQRLRLYFPVVYLTLIHYGNYAL